MKTFILAALMVLIASVVTANHTAGELLGECKLAVALKPSLEAGYCMGFVSATWEGTVVINFSKGVYTKSFDDPAYCIPDGVDLTQMVRVVVKYLEQHPENLHKEAYVEALAAMSTAWPCRVVKK